jgi:hypothetical protein
MADKLLYPWERLWHTPEESKAARRTALKIWQSDHAGQADPGDNAMAQWFVDIERDMLRAEWQDAHPREPVPDDYETIRRWGINSHNKRVAQWARDTGKTFN